jgi:hypothetical protein
MGMTARTRRGAGFLGRGVRRAALPAVAALLLLSPAPDASAGGLEDDLNNGRLGYKWVPDPPKRPLTPEEELGVKVAKYGGGVLVGVWLLRRLFSSE